MGPCFLFGSGGGGGQSTQLPEQLPAGTPGWRLLLLSRIPNLSAAGLAARAPLRDAVWARDSGAGRSSARFLPPQAVRAGGRSWGRLCSFGAELPRQRGVQRLRGAHLHGHALMALPGYGCSPLAWKAPGRALGPRPQRINAGAALRSSLTLKAGAGHSASGTDVRAGLWGAVPGAHLLPQPPGPAAMQWELRAGMRCASPSLCPLCHGIGAQRPRGSRSGSARRCPEVAQV